MSYAYQQLVVLLLQHGILASREEAEALAIKAAHGAAVPPPVKAAIREWLDWRKQPHSERDCKYLVDYGEEAPLESDMYAAWCEANPVSPEVQLFLAKQQQEGALIDPETAEVRWEYGNTLDPYGVFDLPKQFTQIGREYYARRPGSDIWVSYMDLPPETLRRLREKGQPG